MRYAAAVILVVCMGCAVEEPQPTWQYVTTAEFAEDKTVTLTMKITQRGGDPYELLDGVMQYAAERYPGCKFKSMTMSSVDSEYVDVIKITVKPN